MAISDIRPRPRQDSLGNKIPEPAEELALIEREIHELKVGFDHYFLGIDRRAPTRRRDTLGEKLRKFRASGAFKSPMHKFRLEQLASKFSALDRMWTRTLSEMERGTYRRDLNRMRRKQTPQDPARSSESQAPASESSASESSTGSASPIAGAPAVAPGPSRAPTPNSPLTDGQVRALYEAYVSARQRTGQSTAGLTLDTVASTLRKQAPAIMQQHGCSSVDFKVVIKDGRALLRAVPRR